MTYTSLDQLTDRYGADMLTGLTDRASPPAGEIDADVVARALADTDALIDGYISGRYKLPLAETPPLLADLAQAVAIYKLHAHVAPEKIVKDYEAAVSTLKLISAGTVRLPVEGVEPAASGSSGVRTQDRERDITPENTKGYV